MDLLNPRRAPRFSVRFPVEIRHRLEVWNGETEDVGAGGCQIVSPRSVDPGRDVRIAIRCEPLSRTILAAGRVVWARASAPLRLGIAFDPPPIAMDWIEELAGTSPGAVRAERKVPDRLPVSTRVFFGPPPEVVVDFTLTELDVLRRVGSGVTLDAMVRSFGGEMDERTRGALFSLVARRRLVLEPAQATSLAAWKHVLTGRDVDPPPPPVPIRRALGAGRPLEAQRLYDEALSHIGSGRLALAMDRLRDALKYAPDDPTISSTAKRISRWA